MTGKGDELHDGEGRVDGVPAGLQVIDTVTMRLLREFEDVREVLMTQDGRYALATGELLDYRSIDANGNARVVGFGAKVIDLQAIEVLAHIAPDVAFISRVLTSDGRFAHLLSRRTDGGDPERCPDGCAVITVVDLERAEIVAERRLDTRWASLTSLAPQR